MQKWLVDIEKIIPVTNWPNIKQSTYGMANMVSQRHLTRLSSDTFTKNITDDSALPWKHHRLIQMFVYL